MTANNSNINENNLWTKWKTTKKKNLENKNG